MTNLHSNRPPRRRNLVGVIGLALLGLAGCEDACTVSATCATERAADAQGQQTPVGANDDAGANDAIAIGGVYEGVRNGVPAFALAEEELIVIHAEGTVDRVFTSSQNPFDDQGFLRLEDVSAPGDPGLVDSGRATGEQTASRLSIAIDYDDEAPAAIELRQSAQTDLPSIDRIDGQWEGATTTGVVLTWTVIVASEIDIELVGSDNTGCTYGAGNVFSRPGNVFPYFVDRSCPGEEATRISGHMSVDFGASAGGDRLDVIGGSGGTYFAELRRQ